MRPFPSGDKDNNVCIVCEPGVETKLSFSLECIRVSLSFETVPCDS